jgi:integrase
MDWTRPDLQELVDHNRLDLVNKIYLEKYLRYLKLKNLKQSSIKSKIERICLFLKYIRFKDLASITKEELEDFILKRRDEKISEYTIHGERLELKIFYDWFIPENQLFDKLKKPKSELPVEQLLTREDIAKMVKVAGNQRDRALLMVLWDSGCRINEILSRNLGQIEFDRYGAVVIVNGKTGRRRIRLIDAVPDLQQWCNIHPQKGNSEAPLFITYTKYGPGLAQKRLSIRAVQNRFKRIAELAGIPKDRVHPHAYRHARLTDLAKQGYNEMELRKMAGWADDSQMAATYVHLCGGDIEKKQLQKAGLLDEIDHEDTTLTQRKCIRCKTANSPDAMYCSACSMALNENARYNLENAGDSVRNLLAENPKAQAAFMEILKELKFHPV